MITMRRCEVQMKNQKKKHMFWLSVKNEEDEITMILQKNSRKEYN